MTRKKKLTRTQRSELFLGAANRVARGWCQGYVAVDEDGDLVAPTDERAVKWCAVGALRAQAADWDQADEMSDVLLRVLGEDPSLWNDARGRTQTQVVELLQRTAVGYAHAKRYYRA